MRLFHTTMWNYFYYHRQFVCAAEIQFLKVFYDVLKLMNILFPIFFCSNLHVIMDLKVIALEFIVKAKFSIAFLHKFSSLFSQFILNFHCVFVALLLLGSKKVFHRLDAAMRENIDEI